MKYEKPTIEIVKLNDDVITTSGNIELENNGNLGGGFTPPY